MASYLNNYLRGIGAGGYVKDYRHASNLYASSDYRLAPKFKFLYHCVFVLNGSASSNNYRDSEIGFMVKSVDLPGVKFDVEEHKQYNRKSYNYTGIAYNPVSMVFHDDNANNVRNFLANVYNYYVSDGNKVDGQYDVRTLQLRDTYNEESTSAGLSWGIDSGYALQGVELIKEIQIYSLSKGVGSRYILKNPVITDFAHGSHDQSQGSATQESTMSISYDAYTYADVNVMQIPNFGTGPYDRLAGTTTSGLGSLEGGIVQSLKSAFDSVPDRSPYSILSTAAQTAAQLAEFGNQNTLGRFGNGLPSTLAQAVKNANSNFPTATLRKAQEIIKGITI